jgi:hypothetical protein
MQCLKSAKHSRPSLFNKGNYPMDCKISLKKKY